jgi:hypothetical protein
MFRTLIIVLSFLWISLVTDWGAATDPGDVSDYLNVNDDELTIFSIVLKDLPPNRSTIGGSAHEALGLSSENVKELFPEMSADTFADFARRNSNRIVIEEDHVIRPGYPLVPRQAIDSDKTPRYYVFSRVGFRRDRKQAFVYFLDECAPLCARGAFYLLIERDGNWQIVRKEETSRT